MSARAKDTFGLVLVGIGVIVLALFLLLNLPLVIGAILILIAIIFFVVAVLVVVGIIAAVPYYFIKHGAASEPANTYKLDDVRPIKEDEKK
jgi:membrane-bound ClpP family serine protease